jgi:ElaB/YqjD/DUF883 family membrane-anchored ribosome-binding protein
MADCRQKPDNQPQGADYEAFRKQLRELGSALKQIAVAESADALRRVRSEAQNLLAEADALVERLGDVKAAAITGRSSLEGKIRAQPWFALGIAAAAGFLLGSLLQRGRF